MPMEFDAIAAALKQRVPGIEPQKGHAGDPFVRVSWEHSAPLFKAMREMPELAFDSLMCLSGVDTGKEFWVVYNLYSFTQRHRLTVKVVANREKPEVPSVTELWAAANLFEREAYDLYGIVFLQHPDLRRLLLPPDWVGWPMRKDYVQPTDYHGIPLLRQGQFFAEDVQKGQATREARDKEAVAKALAERKEGGA
jgi:NADH-quinone oxidoreductase subunit C